MIGAMLPALTCDGTLFAHVHDVVCDHLQVSNRIDMHLPDTLGKRPKEFSAALDLPEERFLPSRSVASR